MSDLILHHYDTSPFSEKVRKLLAHKRLAWRAVEQPTIMPKPDLLPLTGGYRRIPVLQIGADVYCDTQLIARVLEARHPEPTIYPGSTEGTCHAWNLWADRLLFLASVPVLFAEIGQFLPKAFMDDRSKMMPGRDFNDVPKQAPHARDQLRGLVATIETQLADGRSWLLGSQFSLADAACWHPVWFLRMAPGAMALLGQFPTLQGWMDRVDAMGVGERIPSTPEEALAVARDAQPAAPAGVAPNEPNGLTAGMQVTVTADDYGFDPVAGELVTASAHEVAVRRRDPSLGDVVVHFPRIGFRVAEG
ncbi:MAG TPA: glutathione S-transferase family protein [Candidatus Binatia bacterium]|jgi:glutathione S-transferase|nr:glutathione S-transferase family protein [Candidatus Binatia bacterium]